MQSQRSLLQKRIEQLFKAAAVQTDAELRAEMTKYLCVLASGLMEMRCREILSKYCHKQSAPAVRRFVDSRLGQFRSPKANNIEELLRAFDPRKAESWSSGIDDPQRDAMDSIVANRHLIAHGRSVGLSFSILKRYYSDAQAALDAMQTAFPPY